MPDYDEFSPAEVEILDEEETAAKRLRIETMNAVSSSGYAINRDERD